MNRLRFFASALGAFFLRDASALAHSTPAPTIIASDPCTDPDFQKLWGDSVDALVSPARVSIAAGGYRRITLRDGDDVYGERAQIGRNRWDRPTFCVFREGDRRVITWKARYPASFPRSTGMWQQIMQAKQAQPYTNDENRGDGDTSQGVSLEVQVLNGRIVLRTWWKNRYPSLPMPGAGVAVDHRLDITFSQYPATGSVTLTVAGQAVTWRGATMAYEKATGATIPAALMMGIYRDARIAGDTYVEITNVQVARA